MTISSQICKRIYQADGENRHWVVDFPYLSVSELKVYCTDSSGTETDISAQCELDEIEHEIIYPTLASGQDPLSSDYTLTIVRVTTPTQTLHLTQQGTLDAGELEQGFDKLTLHVQELDEQIKRSIKFPVSSLKTEIDAQTFLTELQTAQTKALDSALAGVAVTVANLEQTVSNEAIARAQADSNLQTAIDSKQNALSIDQQHAVNSGITAAKVSSYQAHLLNTNNPHLVTKAQVGLDNVDNTADIDKPISTAVQSALDGKQDVLSQAQQAAVDSGVTSETVAQVETNKNDIEAINAELDENKPWQKPADWMDIRAGAIDGSIYFLVGHSADYSSYPTFSVKARVSNSGTYDVYVDGIKQATSNDNTTTTLNWQTLALTSGWDVTYPQALRTHIVRITPTVSTNNLTQIQGYDSSTTVIQSGLLWAHFTTKERISVLFGSTRGEMAPLLESITTNKNDELFANIIPNFISNLSKIKHLPIINCEGVGFRHAYAFYYCSSPIKKLRLKKCKQAAQWAGPFTNFSQVEEILADDCLLFAQDEMFKGMGNLKHLPSCIDYSQTTRIRNFLMSDTKLENTVIDVSQNTTLTELSIGGSSSARIDGLKGLTVSPEAPFNGTSPQINVSYTGLDRNALVNLFNSMPTVSASQVCNVTGAMGAADLTAADLAIATGKGWTVTR